MKVRGIIKIIEQDGWFVVRRKGSLDSLGIEKKKVLLLLLGILMMILLRERFRAF